MAAPQGAGKPPLVIDLSLSVAARGKIMVAAQKGEPIPGDWALDAEGQPTTDAKAALAGTMLPIGGAKGSALALMVEVLTASLTGSSIGHEAGSFFTADGVKPRIGQLVLAFAPDPLSGGHFAERMATLAAAILDQPGTRLPGERRLALREKAAKEGITLPAALLDELKALATL
jgi:(2R)-3-sulfolactate dehydrogenase (NADP+)